MTSNIDSSDTEGDNEGIVNINFVPFLASEELRVSIDAVYAAAQDAKPQQSYMQMVHDDPNCDLIAAQKKYIREEQRLRVEKLPPVLLQANRDFEALQDQIEKTERLKTRDELDMAMLEEIRWFLKRVWEALTAGKMLVHLAKEAMETELTTEPASSANVSSQGTEPTSPPAPSADAADPNPFVAAENAFPALEQALNKLRACCRVIQNESMNIYQHHLRAGDSHTVAEEARDNHQHLRTLETAEQLVVAHACARKFREKWQGAETWVEARDDGTLDHDFLWAEKIKGLADRELKMREENMLEAAVWVLKKAAWRGSALLKET